MYGVATFYAMFATSRARRTSCTSATTWLRARQAARRSPPGSPTSWGPRARERRRAGCAARVWACASAGPPCMLQLTGQPDFCLAPAATAESVTGRAAHCGRCHGTRSPPPPRTTSGRPARPRPPPTARTAPDRAHAADRAFADSTPSAPQTPDRSLPLLGRVGVVDPESLDDYRAHGGYAALRRAIQLGPAGCSPRSPTPRSPGAAARRSPPARSGQGWRPRRSGRTTSSATPTSPSPAPSRTGC